MAERYPGATFVEMGPGQVLRGMVSRLVPGCQTISCGTAAEVDSILKMVSS
jgi:[acyl-carrier-protein] S-malonyltransferase